MKTYIIDASVAVKWVVKEIWRVEAHRFLHPNIVCIAPDFITCECINTIQKKVQRNEISEEAGWRCYSILCSEMSIELVSSNPLTHLAYHIANRLGHAVYDCYYLALAERENARMVTADRKLYNRVMMSRFSHLIAWVEDPPDSQ